MRKTKQNFRILGVDSKRLIKKKNTQTDSHNTHTLMNASAKINNLMKTISINYMHWIVALVRSKTMNPL